MSRTAKAATPRTPTVVPAKEPATRSPVGPIDFLLARIALLLVLVISPIVLLGVREADWISGRPLQWISWTAPGPELDQSGPGVVARHSGQIEWSQVDASAGRWLISMIPGLFATASLMICALLLWRMLSRVKAGSPFDRHGGRAVRVIGEIAVLYGVISPVVEHFVGLVLTIDAGQAGAGFRIQPVSLWIAAGGVVLIVLSLVWERGRELAQDVDGLV